MSMNKLATVAVAVALSFAAFTAASAQTVEVVEVVAQPNGCTAAFQNTVTDDGKPLSVVTMSCPRPTHPASMQVAQQPSVKAAAKLN
jgi:hypothetical protein